MTPHERILATLQRKPTDRAPVDLWLTPEVLASLQQHTGVQDELALYQHLGLDKIVWIFPGYDSESFDPNDSRGVDPWGVPTHRVQSGAATYQEYGQGPLADMEDPEELDDHPLWPDPDRFNYQAAAATARRAREHGFATMGPWLSHYEIYCHLRGMENALMDVIAEPEFLEATLDRIESIQSKMLDRFLTELGEDIDLVFISDDLGTQESQLISVPAFEEHLKPRITRWCDLIHRHGKKVLFHTDGAARPFLPHLAECGVDVLNPIQHICPGMETDALKRDFGEAFIFHGGIENQHVLPHGTPDEVRGEVRRCMNTLGRDGGYIVCSCHNTQAGTPVENVLAMIDAVNAK
jgi:uroporphyrinogen decarboxylase